MSGDRGAPRGWYLVAFLSELTEELTPLAVGPHPLVAVRQGEDVRVFDAVCPHRGAHLGYGGRLDRGCIVCPFHGKAIRLGGEGRLGVAEHHVVRAGEAVFLRLGDPADDRGFEVAVKQAAATHEIVAATVCRTAVPAAMVAENAFDVDHFFAVHKVPRMHGMDVTLGPDGELGIDGEFRTATSPWGSEAERDAVRRAAAVTGQVDYATASRFWARAYSPHLVLTEFGGPDSASVVITGAVPQPDGGCVARVAVGVRPDQRQALPGLVHGARKALAEDVVVWDHLVVDAPPRYDARDAPVLAFRQFCRDFDPTSEGTPC